MSREKNRRHIPKINSIHFGGQWILLGIIVGAAVPGVIWVASRIFLWGFCVAGGVILTAFGVVFAVEMRQDNGKIPYYERNLRETIPYDEKKQVAVARVSICTGETVAGFKDRESGHFTEVMLIRGAGDLERFKEIYGLADVKKEY